MNPGVDSSFPRAGASRLSQGLTGGRSFLGRGLEGPVQTPGTVCAKSQDVIGASVRVQGSVLREAPKERGLHVRRGFLIPSLGQQGVAEGFPPGSNLTDTSHVLLSLDGEGGWAVGIFSVFLIDG